MCRGQVSHEVAAGVTNAGRAFTMSAQRCLPSAASASQLIIQPISQPCVVPALTPGVALRIWEVTLTGACCSRLRRRLEAAATDVM